MSALFSSVDMNNAPSWEVLPNKLTGTLTLEHAEIQGVNGNDQIRGEKGARKSVQENHFKHNKWTVFLSSFFNRLARFCEITGDSPYLANKRRLLSKQETISVVIM